MPFDLINVGATYKKIVNEIFKNNLGRNMEACVSDILVMFVEGECDLLNLK